MLKHDKYDLKIILIPCSGSEFNGELSRQVAIHLSEKSTIMENCSFFCSTFFLKNFLQKKEHLFNITKSRLESNSVVVIDGCSTSCIVNILGVLKIKPDMVINLQEFSPKPKINLNDPNFYNNRLKPGDVGVDLIAEISNNIIEQLNEKKISLNTS